MPAGERAGDGGARADGAEVAVGRAQLPDGDGADEERRGEVDRYEDGSDALAELQIERLALAGVELEVDCVGEEALGDGGIAAL